MKRTLSAIALLLVPALALALEFTDLTDRYTDAPFSRAETAGISVLTEVGAVSGNPDGTFAPGRTLNRAEFVKIVLIPYIDAHANAYSGYDYYKNGAVVNGQCFPDVTLDMWFGEYVCEAKDLGLVEGYPDGLFHPEREVNYAEAVKILVGLYDYEIPEPAPNERWAWYTGYIKAAEIASVALPGIGPDHLLTRGQMARLAAAFVANDRGELEEYRLFERGQSLSSSSSQASSSSASSVPSEASSSSAVSSSHSSSSVKPGFPATSRILVAGETTPVLFDGLFTSRDEDAEIRNIVIELRRAIDSIDYLELIDENGNDIIDIPLQSYSNVSKLLWRVDIDEGQGYVLQKNAGKRLGIRARMRTNGNGAVSSEVIELKTLTMYVTGKTTGGSFQIVPSDTHYPWHQTAFGRITSVVNAAESSLSTPEGSLRLLGTFEVKGQKAGDAQLRVDSLAFIVQKMDVTVSNLKIGGPTEAVRSDCGTDIENGATVAICFLPETYRSLTSGSTTVSVYGNVAVNASRQTGTVQLAAVGPGTINTIGGISWSDGANTFTWVDADTVMQNGPVVTVTK